MDQQWLQDPETMLPKTKLSHWINVREVLKQALPTMCLFLYLSNVMELDQSLPVDARAEKRRPASNVRFKVNCNSLFGSTIVVEGLTFVKRFGASTF